jgi:MoaA/NifB/PqqE/SkfB family radical SAM enzyme
MTVQIALEDIDLTKKALYNFVCRTGPGSGEETNSLRMLRSHPFFRLHGREELDGKTAEYYAGEIYCQVGGCFTPEVFSSLQGAFEDSLRTLKGFDGDFVGGKLESIARVKEMSNLRLEAIAEVIGEEAAAFFSEAREAYIDEQYPRQLTIIMTYNCNMSCEFCFSGRLSEKEPGYLRHELFERILSWMDGKGFRNISFFGGEPTIHPEFISYLRRANALGYRTYFATNGLFSGEVLEGLNDTDVLKVTFNMPGNGVFPEDKVDILKRNLRLLPVHIRKSFRFTISEENRDTRLLEELIEEFNPDSLSFALAFPAMDLSNHFVEKNNIRTFAEDITGLTGMANKRGIYSAMVKPVPLCEFKDGEAMFMIRELDLFSPCDIHNDGYTHLTTISTKGRFYPCIALPQYDGLKLDDSPSLNEITRYNRCIVDGLHKKPVLRKCSSCNLFGAYVCQGFCYSYFDAARPGME